MNDSSAKTSDPSKLVRMIATGCGSGLLPIAPGTWGSLFALPLAAVLVFVGGAWLLSAATLVAFVAGVWASGKYEKAMGKTDPGAVVIDEVVGQWLAILPVALDWHYYVVAFFLFRFTDITKPWPARAAERRHGGVGIMLDDVVAGIYAGLLTYAIAVWLGAAQTLPTLFG